MANRDASPGFYHGFQDEIFFGLRRRATISAWIAGLALALATLAIAALVVMLPLKEIKPYVVLVDRTTGEAETVVQTRAADLSERDAIRQAELVRYVSDRETYDVADNPERIPFVLTRSTDQAAGSLRTLWNPSNEEYPPDLYGRDVLVTVAVKSVAILNSATAQVRFTKRRERSGDRPVERDFVATVGFAFTPRVERRLEAVWANPLGFTVTSYRVDAETLAPRSGASATIRETN